MSDGPPDLLMDGILRGAASLTWQPRADVYRLDQRWAVKLDLAGVPSRDVQVEVRHSVLSVSGVRKDRTVQLGFVPERIEIAYSRFERRFEVPLDLPTCRVRLEHEDGMLLIILEPMETS